MGKNLNPYKELSLPDTFCPIPWNFQAIRNNGDLRICCQANVSKNSGILKDKDGNVINAKNADLTAARNSPLMKSVRSKMLQGKWAPECTRCQQEETSGLNSRRQYELKNWSLRQKDVEPLTQPDGHLDTNQSPVVYYDLRFGNLCNLACRMCGPKDSSFWYSDYIKLSGSTHFEDSHGRVELLQKGQRWMAARNGYDWYESASFWSALEKSLPTTQHIYMAGGEPLLIKQHYDFLEKCIERSYAQHIILEYNTNMTQLPDKIVKLWKPFKQVRVGASIDGFGKVFEFQRYPAKWDLVYKNLQKLDSLGKPVFSWLAYTVTIYNIMHLPEFINWKLNQSGFKNINSSKEKPIISYHMAHSPKHLNVRVLTEKQKEKVSQHFKHYRDHFEKNLPFKLFQKSCKILDSVEKYMYQTSLDKQHRQYLKKFNNKLDQLRDQNSAEFLP